MTVTAKQEAKVKCILWIWGIPIYRKYIYVTVGNSIEDYKMGFWWDFIRKFSNDSEQSLVEYPNYQQCFDKKKGKFTIRRIKHVNS